MKSAESAVSIGIQVKSAQSKDVSPNSRYLSAYGLKPRAETCCPFGAKAAEFSAYLPGTADTPLFFWTLRFLLSEQMISDTKMHIAELPGDGRSET